MKIEGDAILNFIAGHINWFKNMINSQVEVMASGLIPKVLNTLNENLQKRIEIPYVNSTIGLKLENSIIYSESEEFFEIDMKVDLEGKSSINEKDDDGFLKTLLYPENSKKKEINEITTLQVKNNSTFSEEVQISIDTNLINNLLKLILKNQKSITITNQILPPDFPFKINTAYFQALIPSLYQKYPDKDLVITIDIDSYPGLKLNTTDDVIEADLNLAISFAVLENPDEKILSISSGDLLKILLDGSQEDDTVHFQVKEIIVKDLTVIATKIGDISSDDIKKSINVFFSSLIYFVNNYLKVNPIHLPIIQGLKFESIFISIIDEGLLVVRCKPNFTQTKFKWIGF
jgi:hypothetical protein